MSGQSCLANPALSFEHFLKFGTSGFMRIPYCQHFLQPNDQVVDLKLLTSWCDGEKPVLMMIYCMYILTVCAESNPSICWLCYQSIWFGHCCETLPYKKYVMVSCWRVRAIYTTVSSLLTTIFCGLTAAGFGAFLSSDSYRLISFMIHLKQWGRYAGLRSDNN